MRKDLTYILLAVILLVSCRREQIPVNHQPDEPDIIINATVLDGTKAIINSSSDLNQTGSMVQVYDILKSFTGQINGTTYNNQDAVYFAEQLVYGGGAWNFPDLTYQWTRTGTHNFFGWLAYDAKSDLTPASILAPSFSNNVLSIQNKTLTTSSEQLDFLYSRNVVVRNAADKNYSPVTLNLAHLFSAIALNVENQSNEPVTLKSVSIPNLPVMNGGVTINYTPDGRTAPVVTYIPPEAGATQFFSNPIPAGGTVLEAKGQANNKIDAFTGEYVTSSTPYNYKLLWPLGADVLSPTRTNPYAGVSGNRYETSENNPADSLIRLSYAFTVRPEIGDPYTIERNDIGVKIPSDIPFAPGKKTYINLTLNDKVVDLTFVVQDWVVKEMPLDFSSGSVTVTSPFSFDAGTYAEKVGNNYYMDISQPITGRFKITNPVGARVFVTPIGDAQYFNISLNHDIVDPKVDMGEIIVSVTPNTTYGTPTSAKKLQLGFYVVNGTQEISINTEVRYEGTIVWSN